MAVRFHASSPPPRDRNRTWCSCSAAREQPGTAPTLDRFVRVAVTRYDRDGLDAGACYDRYPEGPGAPGLSMAALTVYVYPALRPAEEEMRAVRIEIEDASPGMSFAGSAEYELHCGGKRHAGLRMRHRAEGPGPLGPFAADSDTYLFAVERGATTWFVEYRITYPAASADTIGPEILAFMRSLPLP